MFLYKIFLFNFLFFHEFAKSHSISYFKTLSTQLNLLLLSSIIFSNFFFVFCYVYGWFISFFLSFISYLSFLSYFSQSFVSFPFFLILLFSFVDNIFTPHFIIFIFLISKYFSYFPFFHFFTSYFLILISSSTIFFLPFLFSFHLNSLI